MDSLAACADVAHDSLPSGTGPCRAEDAALYLAHTEKGQSLRALAQAAGTHPSTVMRAVRRVEERRDDPLIDDVLARLSARIASGEAAGEMSEADVAQAAKRYLRRLSEPGAFLLLAPGQETGGVFCAANDHRKPIAMMPVAIAAEFAKRDWMRLTKRGNSTVRYHITEAGRASLKRLLAAPSAKRAHPGFAEAPTPFLAQHRLEGERVFLDPLSGAEERRKVNLGESPLGWLSRRKGPDGRAFLDPDEIEAGERLRQDFEAASMGPHIAQDWSKFLTPGIKTSALPSAMGPGEGASAARDRVTKALAALGPGLSDIAFRVCCFLEGIESCEKRMGWAARSGKVVLKIALQRLSDHYGLARLSRRA